MTELTVLMPVYNAEKWLSESIGSVLGQSYSDFKFLVYDDGSTDDSVKVVESFKDPRISLIKAEENRGGIYARTQLIRKIDTKYCMWCDADDAYCRTDAFESAMKKIKRGGFDMVNFTRINEVSGDGKVEISEPYLYGDFTYCGDKLFEKFYPTESFVNFHSKIFKSEVMKKSCPGEDILSQRFIMDDLFFCPMWWFHSKKYCHITTDEPMYAYKNYTGFAGTKRDDVSPTRIGEWVLLQYHLVVSLYNRCVMERPLNGVELENLLNGALLPSIARVIGSARKIYGDEYADSLVNIWHSAFGADGVHLLNGVDVIVAPTYIKDLENTMNNAK